MRNDIDVRIEQRLRQRLGESELQRATAALVFFGVMFLSSLVFLVHTPAAVQRQFAHGAPTQEVALLFGVAVLLAYLVRRRVLRLVALGRGIGRGEGAALTLVEMAALFGILWMGLSRMGTPAAGLFSPMTLLLPVIVVLSAQRMDPAICWLAGGAAALAYFVTGWAVLGGASDLPDELTSMSAHVPRSLMLLALGGVTAFVTRSLRRSLVQEVESVERHHAIRRVFGQHVSPEVVDRLLAQQSGTVSELRHVCLMFLDIRDFTALAENLPPQGVVDLLNRFFTLTIDAVNERSGIVNKFLGDGFMAVFGAPLPDGRAAVHAVEAAEAILATVSDETRTGASHRCVWGSGSTPATPSPATSGARRERSTPSWATR